LTIILFVILIFSGDFLAGIFHFEFIKPFYWLFCIGFFGISMYQILTYWTLRSKDYITITHTRISQSISGSVSKIVLGILSLASFGLICGDLIGRMVGISTLGRKILPKIWLSIHNFDFHKLRGLAYRYRKFPVFSLPSAFVNVLSLQVPALFLSGMYGFEIVGLYALTFSMLVLPVSLISSSISQVFLGESSEIFRHKRDQILLLYQKTTKKLFMFGAPIILTGAVISPILFPIIFGSAWKEAGMFSLPLSSMIIAQFVVSSTDRLELYGYNHWELIYNIIRTFLVLSGFYLAFLFKISPVATVLVYSLIMTIMYAVNYTLNIKAITRVLQKNDVTIKN